MEDLAVETISLIHRQHLLLKPLALRRSSKKDHAMLSNAFLKSNLYIIPLSLDLLACEMISLAAANVSVMFHPLTNAD